MPSFGDAHHPDLDLAEELRRLGERDDLPQAARRLVQAWSYNRGLSWREQALLLALLVEAGISCSALVAHIRVWAGQE